MDAQDTHSPDRGGAPPEKPPNEPASVAEDRPGVGRGHGHVDVDHLARLAALRLDGNERLGVERDLRRIIALVDEMQAVATEGVEPLAHPLDATQRLRPDEATERVDRERCQAGAPETRDGLYLVPSVLSE